MHDEDSPGTSLSKRNWYQAHCPATLMQINRVCKTNGLYVRKLTRLARLR
jgi:hypothetical protein